MGLTTTNIAQELADRFETETGYRFEDATLLDKALTHPSFTSCGAGNEYQRLEFLGDRVLGLVIATELFHRFSLINEGELARQLNYLVRKQTCAAAFKAAGLHALVETKANSPGAAQVTARVLGDTCEAVIAAVCLDGGYDAAYGFVKRLWEPYFDLAQTASRDAKTVLQEWSLGRGLGVPDYREISRSGPAHAPEFEIGVKINDMDEVTAKAGSKRRAEQLAAAAFMEQHGIQAA